MKGFAKTIVTEYMRLGIYVFSVLVPLGILVVGGLMIWRLRHPSVLILTVENRTAVQVRGVHIFSEGSDGDVIPAIASGARRTTTIRGLAEGVMLGAPSPTGAERAAYLGYLEEGDTLRVSYIATRDTMGSVEVHSGAEVWVVPWRTVANPQ